MLGWINNSADRYEVPCRVSKNSAHRKLSLREDLFSVFVNRGNSLTVDSLRHSLLGSVYDRE
jgi:hypothetical protein